MKKLLCCLSLLLALALTAADTTLTADFEAEQPGDGHPLKAWIINDFFKPMGTAGIVQDEFKDGGTVRRQAVRLRGSASQPAHLIHNRSLAVARGDVIVMDVLYKAAPGDQIRVGYYGNTAQGAYATMDAAAITAIDAGWDRRQTTFVIRHDTVATIRPFVGAAVGKEAVFSFVHLEKLSEEKAFYYSPIRSIAAFEKACDGVNLAKGIIPAFSPRPNYSLTVKGDTDDTDLTDGKYASTHQIWFEQSAVGFERAVNGVNITLDLGGIKRVRKAVIRLQGGIIDKYTIAFPNELEVWVSKDGRDYYRGQSLVKLKSTEAELSNWDTLYYLPETTNGRGVCYVYPFELKVNADARYVIIRTPSNQFRTMFSDELAVIEATAAESQAPGYNGLYKTAPELLTHGSLLVKPKMPVFYIAENLYLPNLLFCENQLPATPKSYAYAIDLPQQVTFRETAAWPADSRRVESVTTQDGRTTWLFKPQSLNLEKFCQVLKYGFGPFYFTVENAAQIPASQRYAVFTTYVDGQQALQVRRPLEVLSIPKVTPHWRQIDNSLWLEDRFKDMPDCDRTSLDLGFSTAMFFPRSVKDAERLQERVRQARANGLKIRLELEPTLILRQLNGGKNATRCVGSASTCLAYRGEEYQKNVADIREIVRLLPCDTITFDIEDWEPNRMDATMDHCTRCQAEKAKRGYATWIEYFDRMQAEYVSAYTDAALQGAKDAGRTPPRIGYYAVSPVMAYNCREGRVPFLGYSHLYPRLCDEIQNSYYGDSARECHDQMREVYRQIPHPAILMPWRSGGTGAYYGVPRYGSTEQHIVETLMNGAGGIQFFCSKSFESPLDYFYLARAFAMLAPYEDILLNGSLLTDCVADNPNLVYTARELGGRRLFLAGNYGSRTPANASLPLPNHAKVTVLSADGTAAIADHALQLTIPADSFILCLLE